MSDDMRNDCVARFGRIGCGIVRCADGGSCFVAVSAYSPGYIVSL